MGIFSEIPYHNQIDVLKKLDFKDFINFKKCSKETVEMTENFRQRLPLKLQELRFSRSNLFTIQVNEYKQIYRLELILEEPVLLEVEKFQYGYTLSHEEFRFLQEFCQKTKMTAKMMLLGTDCKNKPSFVDNVMKLLSPEVLTTWGHPSSYVIGLQELKKMKRISFSNGFMADSDFLLLENPQIEIEANQIVSSVTNAFFKQWMAGKREVEYLRLCIDGDYLEMMKDLDFSILFSPETQETSPFAHLRKKILYGGVTKIYSLKRNDGKKIFIETCESSFAPGIVVAGEYNDLEDVEKYIRRE